MRKDDWIKAAMTDDTMVAELLMRLNHNNNNNNQYSSSSSDSYASSSSLPEKRFDFELPLIIKWGNRKPRSRLILLRHSNIMNHHHQKMHIQAKKESDLIQGSPTTPLSWSPGSSSTTLSGGGRGSDGGGSGDCYEESSRPYNWFSNCRSKAAATTGSNIRRSRKRKTFAELREEESFLLKEKMHLKKELVTLRNSYGGRKAISDSLKGIELHLRSRSIKETGASNKTFSTDQFRNTHGIIDEPPTVLGMSGKFYKSESCEGKTKVAPRQDCFFVLPDLNMPFEEETGTDVLYGLS